ncbi:MAG: Fe-S protein assembly co-chaperone HscB [Bacteroidota bacterium]|jgi:molecular chaperone HscB
MNYFEFYQLPLSCHPDQDLVKKNYYANSKKYHPDRFMQADAKTKIEALQQSALNNEAYTTLQDPMLTIAHLLRIKGLLLPDEKYQLPSSFLMEVMDLNEQLSDWENQGKDTELGQSLQQSVHEFIKQLQDDIAPAMQLIDSGQEEESLFLKLKEFYFKHKYLLRIKERMSIFATHD